MALITKVKLIMEERKILNYMLTFFKSIYLSSNINEIDYSGIDYYVNLIISRNLGKDPHTNLFNGFVRNFERQSSFFVDECYKERKEARDVIKKISFLKEINLAYIF